MISDPDLLDEVAGNSEQFGKKVEGINFFTQLQGARGGGLSVISDSPVYDKVREEKPSFLCSFFSPFWYLSLPLLLISFFFSVFPLFF